MDRRKKGPVPFFGFTLIEMIMVIVITAILASVGIPLLVNLTNSFQFSIARKNLSESAEVALRRMDREIRRLRNIASISTATSSTYAFTDIDNNSIQYARSGSTLQRTLNGTVDTLADNVTSLTFTYYDDSENIIATPTVSPNPTDIRLVQIDITFIRDTNTINYRTQVRLMRIKHLSDPFF